MRFTEEQEMWRKMLNDFTDKEGGAEYTRRCDLEGRFPQEWWEKGVQQGWLGLLVSEKYGGENIDEVMFTIFSEVTAKYCEDMGNLFSRPMMLAKIIERFGSEEQKQQYLPRFVRGEIVFSISITEPGAGSDAAAVATSAVLDGDHFVVNGSKIFTSAGNMPNNIMLVACRTDKKAPKHEGISVLLIPNDLPGVEVRPMPLIVARAIQAPEIFLTDVRVPRENLLGELNKGWTYLTSELEIERLNISAAIVGEAQTALNEAVNYAKQRVQFGRPISKFQAIRDMIADLQTELEAARLLVYNVASLIKDGIPCNKEASMAKLYAAEVFARITNAGMQIMGGYSMDPMMDMERHWRNSKISTIGGGTSQIQRMVIAREMGL
ncbi:MAG TPA: acyl-CoA/acyl-ACP dehydrogenase [Dehalococcoidia bacterium]|nr:acyl-CoA/acyl-ACP dehydrogenase [Dehalococcoidia bacterium]